MIGLGRTIAASHPASGAAMVYTTALVAKRSPTVECACSCPVDAPSGKDSNSGESRAARGVRLTSYAGERPLSYIVPMSLDGVMGQAGIGVRRTFFCRIHKAKRDGMLAEHRLKQRVVRVCEHADKEHRADRRLSKQG